MGDGYHCLQDATALVGGWGHHSKQLPHVPQSRLPSNTAARGMGPSSSQQVRGYRIAERKQTLPPYCMETHGAYQAWFSTRAAQCSQPALEYTHLYPPNFNPVIPVAPGVSNNYLTNPSTIHQAMSLDISWPILCLEPQA